MLELIFVHGQKLGCTAEMGFFVAGNVFGLDTCLGLESRPRRNLSSDTKYDAKPHGLTPKPQWVECKERM